MVVGLPREAYQYSLKTHTRLNMGCSPSVPLTWPFCTRFHEQKGTVVILQSLKPDAPAAQGWQEWLCPAGSAPKRLSCPHKHPGAPQHSVCQDAPRKRQCSAGGRKGRVENWKARCHLNLLMQTLIDVKKKKSGKKNPTKNTYKGKRGAKGKQTKVTNWEIEHSQAVNREAKVGTERRKPNLMNIVNHQYQLHQYQPCRTIQRNCIL